MTLCPSTTLSPIETRNSAPGGRNTSMREPNFMMPKRSPALSSAPGFTRQTTRRARMPTIWRNTTAKPS